MRNLFTSAVAMAKDICERNVEKGDVVVDATMGNGNDTAFLCELVGEKGKVYAFDIQEGAITNTKKRLSNLNFESRVELIHDGHENIDKYVREKVKLIIYNLGYLPKGNHEITTYKDTTIESIRKGLEIIDESGLILIVVYPGHESGQEEKIALENFVSNLDQKVFSSVSMRFINQINNPPEIICIEKLNKGESANG